MHSYIIFLSKLISSETACPCSVATLYSISADSPDWIVHHKSSELDIHTEINLKYNYTQSNMITFSKFNLGKQQEKKLTKSKNKSKSLCSWSLFIISWIMCYFPFFSLWFLVWFVAVSCSVFVSLFCFSLLPCFVFVFCFVLLLKFLLFFLWFLLCVLFSYFM